MDLDALLPGRQPQRTGLDLSVPFTPMTAARAGIGRAALERLVRDGGVVRLLRGVYVGTGARLSTPARARALALVVSARHLVTDRTAAWVHGAPALRADPTTLVPLDLHGRRHFPGPPVPVPSAEVVRLGGIRVTTPLRTALDVARHLAPERALSLLDGLVRAGAVTHTELIAGAAAAGDLPGISQARELAAIADGRAASIAESVLRMHWLGGNLPTPAPGWRVAGVRLALALPVHRFGVVLAPETDPARLVAVQRAGWTVLVLDEHRVRRSDPGSAAAHLEREFHLHLLDQMT